MIRFQSVPALPGEAVNYKIPYRRRAVQAKPIGGARLRRQAFFFVSFLLGQQKKWKKLGQSPYTNLIMHLFKIQNHDHK